MPEMHSNPDPDRPYSLTQQLLGGSRIVITLAAIGAFLASMTLLLYGVGVVIVTIKDLLQDLHFNEKGAKHLSLTFIQLVDTFLLGTVIYIIAIGLYELFVDDNLPTPKWLHITTLDDLKEKMIGVVIVLLGVTFLAQATDWSGDRSIMYLGVAIGLVIISLMLTTTFAQMVGKKKASEKE
ncbi:YqhA family protein [soil metagenome]